MAATVRAASSGTRSARFVGRSDSRPNFNVVFRAPGLETHLGPAVQYWVVGGRTSGLIGRLDLAGIWWAGFPSIDAAYGTAHASELIDGLIGAPSEHKVLATDPWTARMMVSDSFSSGRVFLVGECAHVNPPWGGHGFNTSVGDAVNIAWKIAAVEHGWAPAELLASYSDERRGVVEQTVASAASNMPALAGDLSVDAAAIQRAKRPEFYSLGLVLGYSYAGSRVIQPSARPDPAADTTTYTPAADPGARLPHAWLPDGSSLYDHLGRGFTLLGPVHDRPVAVAGLADHARSLGIPLALCEPPEGYPWHDEFLLVRPDQHIAWRAADPAGIDLGVVTGRASTSIAERGAFMASQEQASSGVGGGGKIALANARVFDGQLLDYNSVVVIEDGLISTGSGGAQIVDCGGAVLLPGLIDAHVHLDGPGRLSVLASYGVTTVLDMASVPEETAKLRGIGGQTDFRTAGIPAIAPGSLHSHFPGVGQRGLINGPDEAEQFVAERVAEGSDYIKIVIGSPFADHDQATVDALVAAAHANGKLVVAHASSVAAVDKALAAGADILTHAPLDQPLDPLAAAEVSDEGRVVVPTLTMMESIVANVAPPGADYANARASVGLLHEAGVPILAGTDANDSPGTPSRVPYGESLHRELELLAEAGLSPLEIILAATALPARYFGLDDRGTIEPGKRADLILIEEDPLADIRATRSILRVWCGGIEHEPAQMRK